jgi:predicted ribosomally synthesized peptide with nif11-like leader
MSEEQLKAFLEAVKADTGLQEKLKGVEDADAVVAIAKEAGFVISAEEFSKPNEDKELSGRELSDEELEVVAGGGGRRNNCDKTPNNKSYTIDKSVPDCSQ